MTTQKTPRQELNELRAQYGAQLAASKAAAPQTKKTVEVKQDKRRAQNSSLKFDYSSTYFAKALAEASNPQ